MGTHALAATLPEESALSAEGAVRELIKTTHAAADPRNPYLSFFPPNTELLSAVVGEGKVTLTFNDHLGFRMWTPESAAQLRAALSKALAPLEIDSQELVILIKYKAAPSAADPIPLEEHVFTPERVRARGMEKSTPPNQPLRPVVTRIDRAAPAPTKGLEGRTIVMGPSHGWTWHEENRWQMQRARLFTQVEDIYPLSYVNPFIIPMLENAGANVFSVRERDYQSAEVIVDFERNWSGSACITEGRWSSVSGGGWSGGVPASLARYENPFEKGSTAEAVVEEGSVSVARHVPYIPRDGRYAVYTSWKSGRSSSASVPVTVHHLGGSTTFHVNQQVGAATWIFLGFFEFAQGANAERGSVETTTEGARVNPPDANGNPSRTVVNIDAVRFGGGIGNVAVQGRTSGAPRVNEAAKYFLQYSGAPSDEVVERSGPSAHFGPDYWADINARAEWPNYLTGRPAGPNGYRDDRGLGIPVDLYLSFHTDAGVDPTGVYGTLTLYRLWDDEGSLSFPDGRPRMLNRDLAHLLHNELLTTAGGLYTSTWESRALQQRDLGEIRRPNVPSTLLELLSHQNFNDMKYGLDPRWKRDMGRAIYKGITRFIAYQDGVEPVIQPLAPVKFSVTQDGKGGATLTWEPQADPLEPSAVPTGYVVYTSRDGRSFDNGIYTTSSSIRLSDLPERTLLAWRVTAVNDGGESFPTATLAMRWAAGADRVLIVDGFDRLAGPAIVEDGTVRGFDRKKDPGVGFHYTYGLAGDQYDFDPKSEWINDLESTGWGASNSDMENRLEKGNSFDHSVTHGVMLAELDFAFDSTTVSAFAKAKAADYKLIDWIAGRQRTTLPPGNIPRGGAPDRMKTEFALMSDDQATALLDYVGDGGRLLISGAHIGEELLEAGTTTPAKAALAKEGLGIEDYELRPATVPAIGAEKDSLFAAAATLRFGVDLDASLNLTPLVYPVTTSESYSGNPAIFLRYGESAADASRVTTSTVTIGVPLEAVLPQSSRMALMRGAMRHLTGKSLPEPTKAAPQ